MGPRGRLASVDVAIDRTPDVKGHAKGALSGADLEVTRRDVKELRDALVRKGGA
jgi:hypothetical protein